MRSLWGDSHHVDASILKHQSASLLHLREPLSSEAVSDSACSYVKNSRKLPAHLWQSLTKEPSQKAESMFGVALTTRSWEGFLSCCPTSFDFKHFMILVKLSPLSPRFRRNITLGTLRMHCLFWLCSPTCTCTPATARLNRGGYTGGHVKMEPSVLLRKRFPCFIVMFGLAWDQSLWKWMALSPLQKCHSLKGPCPILTQKYCSKIWENQRQKDKWSHFHTCTRGGWWWVLGMKSKQHPGLMRQLDSMKCEGIHWRSLTCFRAGPRLNRPTDLSDSQTQ